MRTIEYRDGVVRLIDQTKLPLETVLLECRDVSEVADAIRHLAVRGAPAIGLAAGYGVALAAQSLAAAGVSEDAFETGVEQAIAELWSTRPTAVNLFWALQRMRSIIERHAGESPQVVAEQLLAEADRMLAEDEAANRRIGRYGAELIPDGANILTHCNTGALATGAFGTALGAIRTAHEEGKRIHVWVDETRPLLQGARLTTWELQQLSIPFTLITDNMAGHFMKEGRIDLAMVGADRIAANGDTANKIGTYTVAVLAHAHDIPFYAVAPITTVDLAIPSGREIAIEERKAEEVAGFRETRWSPEGVQVANPAFDVTPARLISGIVTDRGVVRPPFEEGLARVTGELAVSAVPQ